MKKVFILVWLLAFYAIKIFAQAPQKFSFQGVARNSSGQPVTNQTVGLRLTIHQGSANGMTVYQETHTSQTNAVGVFNVAVGGGNVTSGTFWSIDWSSQSFFLQVELNPTGVGNSYTNVSTSQLLSVPYALHSYESSRWKNDYPIVQTGTIDSSPPLGDVTSSRSMLIWYPRKAAFRAGMATDGSWDDFSIGRYSTAFGYNSKATGGSSMAVGESTQANGASSLAAGRASIASGNYSIALGYGVKAGAMAAVTLGRYNDISDNPDQSVTFTYDRIFQVGNGSGTNDRRNALTILRNGNIGIGNNVLEPEYRLDVGSRMRIRHNGSLSAGIDFNNEGNSAMVFFGARSDNESAGLYFYDGANSGNWRFWVNKNGNGYLNGNLIQTSDRRLKRDIQPLRNSFLRLAQLQGYHYHWKDSTRSQNLQTGLIAQEVEAHFPELVETNEKGYKSVNYLGLIPHLLEAVKELRSDNMGLQAQLAEMAILRQQMESLKALEARLSQLVSSLSEPTALAK
ncbi:tail fiber domain-containing protein [Spirosoma sp.]|uniref:tail fiber domain-containing protein n=1 Tax=Spirosoma sp. TaxID=1899569 RepID=UPI003B3BD9D4